ncbi:uncharacterized protein LOC113793121 [Dermatophagoides pteronyssinus]|uniref:uncharacterized protein LOC113793121 n=1 Tax=Dermatophagoides pteronyssinus TaxID=6956 RepID=UPI003F66FF6E
MLTTSNQSTIDPIIISQDYKESDVNKSSILLHQEPSLPPPLPKPRPNSTFNNNNNVLMMMSSASSSTPNIMTNNVTNNNDNKTNKSNVGRTKSTTSNTNMATTGINNNGSSQQPMININPQQRQQQLQNEELSVLTSYYACARYYLFMIYLLVLITLIINTFIHFIFYGSNMSIGSMFLDVHHRHELINGNYYSFDNNNYDSENYHSASTFNIGKVQHGPYGMINHRPSSSKHEQIYYCDRSSFLSLLDEFYHQYPMPKSQPPTYDSADRMNQPDNDDDLKSYPKIFANFDNYARTKDRQDLNEEDDIFYSSSSRSNNDDESLKTNRQRSGIISDDKHRYKNHHKRTGNENRMLIIEVIALTLLFVTVLNQVLGLIGVIRKNLTILIFVTIVNFVLFCILAFISNIGLILLLLLATSAGYLFIFQLKIGLRRRIKERLRFKEDISAEVQDAIMQMRNRMSPCIHVSMEQYEAMTQQMLNRYSSPIVYCPHYNESLC